MLDRVPKGMALIRVPIDSCALPSEETITLQIGQAVAGTFVAVLGHPPGLMEVMRRWLDCLPFALPLPGVADGTRDLAEGWWRWPEGCSAA